MPKLKTSNYNKCHNIAILLASLLIIKANAETSLQNINDKSSEQKHVYIVNLFSNSYTTCSVDKNSGIDNSSCQTTTLNNILNGPAGIAISNNFVYITNSFDSSYTQCSFTQTNGINAQSCKKHIPTGVGALSQPVGITIYENFAFFANSNTNSYTQCNIDPKKGIILSSCDTIFPVSINGSASIQSPSSLAIHDKVAYFLNNASNPNNAGFTTCLFDQSSGIEPNSCLLNQTSPQLFNGPNRIIFKNNSAYIVNYGNSTLLSCIIVASGGQNFMQCQTPSSLNNTLIGPADVAINDNFIYIVNAGVGSIAGNSYTQCKINSFGIINVNTCNKIINTQLNGPFGIAFK